MPIGPSTQNQAFFIIQGIDSLHIGTVVKVMLEVVLINRLKGFARVCRLQQMSKPKHLCEPLTEKLVGEASITVLISNLAVLNCAGMPFFGASLFYGMDLLRSRDFLDVEVPVPQFL